MRSPFDQLFGLATNGIPRHARCSSTGSNAQGIDGLCRGFQIEPVPDIHPTTAKTNIQGICCLQVIDSANSRSLALLGMTTSNAARDDDFQYCRGRSSANC